ncbi:hypothetical protein EK0264_03610 [Epidermidibacterium keratini]|uniref:Uncharacterized protein n=1 Tax=Epidermidibacterium keratini TaxID=1891644 RepID=A0A7L4YLM9_9ACTN|nr:hypothetical protein [Epidermidibacterium keratini]QHB99456.1 hypothetical protein EK0264_03610 [Epidermidibacterium keratini]
MTRAYGSISSLIWRDGDFTSLPIEAQWLYFALVTQPDISSAGVLTLAERRWAGYTSNPQQHPDDIMTALEVLADKRFVGVDVSTSEVLVRSFIRHDGGYQNTKRHKAIAAAIRSVASPMLLAIIQREIANLDMENKVRDTLCPTWRDAVSRDGEQAEGYPKVMVTVTDQVTDPVPNYESGGSESSSSNESNARGLRAVGGTRSTKAGDE